MCVNAQTDTREPELSHAEKVRARAGKSGERVTTLGSNGHHLDRNVGICKSYDQLFNSWIYNTKKS